MSAPGVPGVTVSVLEPPSEATPLRTDVAGLLGRTRRGPLLEPVRVAGWRGFMREFGDLVQGAATPYAARGYFDNGGEDAYVVRVAGAESAVAHGVWTAALPGGGGWAAGTPARANFGATRYRVEATSPGVWGNRIALAIRYRSAGISAAPEVDVRVEAPGESVERYPRVPPPGVADALSASRLVRLVPLDEAPPPNGEQGPRSALWQVRLDGGSEALPTRIDYLAAARRLQDEAEVALLAVPDLHGDLRDPVDVGDLIAELLESSAGTRDRLVLIDLPRPSSAASDAVTWVEALRAGQEASRRRSGAAYHPWLVVPDPLGGTARPLLPVPPSGHVAGLISRLDRERGAAYSPANALVSEAVDIDEAFDEPAQTALYAAGINLVRCSPRGGLEAWGASTLDREPEGRFVAHRRLIHRLVRAIRRVAEPLVFETNGPELRFTLARSVTTVLLEAYESGALKGSRPEEAFSVRCDESNNPPEQRELGRVICEIAVAPAAPMKFIHLRLSFAPGGLLEVVEA